MVGHTTGRNAHQPLGSARNFRRRSTVAGIAHHLLGGQFGIFDLTFDNRLLCLGSRQARDTFELGAVLLPQRVKLGLQDMRLALGFGQRAFAIVELLATLVEQTPLLVDENHAAGQRGLLLGQLYLACLQGHVGFGADRERFFPCRDLDLRPERLAFAKRGRANAFDLEGPRPPRLLDARASPKREPQADASASHACQ